MRTRFQYILNIQPTVQRNAFVIAANSLACATPARSRIYHCLGMSVQLEDWVTLVVEKLTPPSWVSNPLSQLMALIPLTRERKGRRVIRALVDANIFGAFWYEPGRCDKRRVVDKWGQTWNFAFWSGQGHQLYREYAEYNEPLFTVEMKSIYMMHDYGRLISLDHAHIFFHIVCTVVLQSCCREFPACIRAWLWVVTQPSRPSVTLAVLTLRSCLSQLCTYYDMYMPANHISAITIDHSACCTLCHT